MKFTFVNSNFVGVSWTELFENRPQQNCFQIFHFLLMKANFSKLIFSVLVTFLSCSVGNKN